MTISEKIYPSWLKHLSGMFNLGCHPKPQLLSSVNLVLDHILLSVSGLGIY